MSPGPGGQRRRRTWTRVDCQNPDCDGYFSVASGVPMRECHRCGLTHHAPWDDPSTILTVSEDNVTESETLQCRRCGTEYDTDRDLPVPGANPYRCPSCGRECDRAETPVPAAELARADGGPPGEVADALDSVESGGDVHLHVHYHD